MDFFLDTSALVKRHVNETGSAWVRSQSRPGTGHERYIARVTAVEVFAAITRGECGGHLTSALGWAIIGHFRRQMARRYNVFELTPRAAHQS